MEKAKGYTIHGLTLIKQMAKQTKHNNQGLLVLSLVLLSCFAIPGHEGKSIDYSGSETKKGGNYEVMANGVVACIKQISGHYAGYFCCSNTQSRHNGVQVGPNMLHCAATKKEPYATERGIDEIDELKAAASSSSSGFLFPSNLRLPTLLQSLLFSSSPSYC